MRAGLTITVGPGRAPLREGRAFESPAPAFFVGRYLATALLGVGGMGEVYLGYDPLLGRSVAIKRLLAPADPRDERRERLRLEAQLQAKLNHPNVVRVYDLYSDGDHDHIITEYVEGATLNDLLGRQPLPLERAVRMALAIARGVAHAHAHRIVHLDLKSENVLVDRDGVLKVADFGIAQMALEPNQSKGKGRAPVGTPSNMSPEQSLGRETDARSDLFSLGTLFYELFTGVSPFQRATEDGTLHAIREEVPVPLRERTPTAPLELARLVEALHEKRPEDRPRDASLVVSALERVLDARETSIGWRASARTALERRQVAIAHVDLVFNGEHGEDYADALAAFDAHVARQASRHGASILSRFGTKCVLCVGHPEAFEDASARAAELLLELGAAIAESATAGRTGSGEAPALRAGLDVGEALICKHETSVLVVGNVIDVAVALGESAPAGAVYVTARAQEVLGRRFRFSADGLLEIVKQGTRIARYRLRGARADLLDIEEAHRAPLVGRDQPLAELEASWTATVSENRGRAVALLGEAGIGKSRLVQELWQRVGQRGGLRYSTHATASGQASPYHALRSLFTQALERDATGAVNLAEIDSWGSEVGEQDATWALHRLFGEAARGSEQALDSEGAGKLRTDLASLLRALAKRAPVLLVIDDLQWLDPSSRVVLHTLLKRLDEVPLFVVLAARPERQPAWLRSEAVRCLELERLGPVDGLTLIDHLRGDQNLPGTIRHRLQITAEGVPLMLEELTRSVLAEREGAALDQRDRSIPSSLRESLEHRLHGLGPERETAECAAVLGREVVPELLLEIAGLSNQNLSEHLQQLVDARLFAVTRQAGRDTWSFRHALLREALYGTLTPARRAALHRRVVAALDGPLRAWLDARPEWFAEHYEASEEIERAIDLWTMAGISALRSSSHQEARLHLERAITLSNTPNLPRGEARERELRLLLGPCLTATEGWSSEAVKTNDRALTARAASGQDSSLSELWTRWSYGVVGHDLRVAETALAELDRQTDTPQKRFLSATAHGYVAFYDGNFRQAEHAFEEALAIARRDELAQGVLDAVGDWVLTVPRQQLLWIYALRGQVERALLLQWESEQATRAGGMLPRLNVWAYGVSLGLSLGRTPHACELLERCGGALLSEAEAHGLALYAAMARVGQGRARVLAGYHDAGVALMERGHEQFLAAGVAGAGQVVYTAGFVDGCLEAGAREKAEPALDHAFKYARDRLGFYYLPEVYRLQAQLHLTAGRIDEARGALEAAEREIERLTRRDRTAPLLLGARVAATRLLVQGA
jgi:tetratricopeptide (TPR) repeat protein